MGGEGELPGENSAEVNVVSQIVISCVVAHALHAWLLVSPSVTTRSLITNPVANMRCLVATRSLIRNPVAIMRCACKASENPPRSLIRDRFCIVDTRVCGWGDPPPPRGFSPQRGRFSFKLRGVVARRRGMVAWHGGVARWRCTLAWYASMARSCGTAAWHGGVARHVGLTRWCGTDVCHVGVVRRCGTAGGRDTVVWHEGVAHWCGTLE